MLRLPMFFEKTRLLIQYFTDHSSIQSEEERHRARILAGSLILISLSSILTTLGLFINFLITDVLLIGTYITVITSIYYFLILLVLKRIGQVKILAQAFAIPFYFVLIYASFVSGGPEATSAQIMLVVPVLMIFIAGLKAGLIWSMVLIISQLVIFLMYKNGFQFTQNMTPEVQIEQGLVHWVLTVIGVMGITIVYEKANRLLIMQRNKKESDNRFLSKRDMLTSCLNRHTFIQQLDETITLAQKDHKNFHLVLIKVKDLQQLNNRYGYEQGDKVLKELAERLSTFSLLTHLCRFTHNEFIGIVPQSGDLSMDEFFPQILEVASEPFIKGHEIINIHVKLAFSSFPHDGNTADRLISICESKLSRISASPREYYLE